MIKKQCEICQRVYEARKTQRTCSYQCSAKRHSRLMRDRPWSETRRKAIARKTQRAIRILVDDKYGEITKREMDLFNEGHRLGWRKGYDSALYRTTRDFKRTAA